ncbi:MAG: phosphotransferase enzyme family protein [Bacillota bacterium]
MLKLKYLYSNSDLAAMIVKNWEYDESSLELFKYYRISANAIYPFKQNDKICILRFAPTTEKTLSNLLAERDFVSYLGANGYPALRYKSSLNGNDVEIIHTPWGDYYASVFERVPGKPLADADFTNEIGMLFGRSLGRLHRLSSQYTPTAQRRWSYQDILQWIEAELSPFANQELAKKELAILKEALAKLPRSAETFGLIHYDFELDNVFYEPETGVMSVIDFDDAVYSWYAMDIEQTLDSIESELGSERFPGLKASFLSGYRQEFTVSDQMLAHMALFRRFARLYGYTRVLRSTAETWANEPEWMVKLRSKLKNNMVMRSQQFGQPIEN